MTLRVIGAGWGRTGTDSMREALTILGFGPCHHMYELNQNPEQKRLWRALAAGGPRNWDSLFAGYASCVDWPSVFYWRDLVRDFPEAKVILTWRSPESWWTSFSDTILRTMQPPADPQSVGVALVAQQQFHGHPEDRDRVIAMYEAHVDAVKAEVAPHRLLIHSLGDGWAPLCAHLGVAIPSVPYPSRNSSRDFHAGKA
jgi:hypothetical protein